MSPPSPTVWLDMTFGSLLLEKFSNASLSPEVSSTQPADLAGTSRGVSSSESSMGLEIYDRGNQELFSTRIVSTWAKCGGGETIIWNGIHFNLLRRRAHNTPVRMFQVSVAACSGDGLTTGGSQVRRSINKMSRLHGKYMCTVAEPKCRGDGLTTYSRCSRCDQDVCVLLLDFSLFEPCNARRHGGRTQSRRKIK